MSAGMLFVLWKGVLGFGLPIAFALWELHKLRKYRGEDEDEAATLFERKVVEHPQPVTIAIPKKAAKVPELV